MLDNLLDLIRQHAGTAILNNPAIPDHQHEAAIAETGNSILGTLQNLISQGNGQDVVNLLQHKGGDVSSNPAVGAISSGLVQNLMHKFGLDTQTANGVAGGLIPNVIQSLVHKVNDPNDSSFNLQSILASLTGGQGIQGLLTDLEKGGGASITDKIKGLFNQQ